MDNSLHPAHPLNGAPIGPDCVLLDSADHTMVPAPFIAAMPNGGASLPCDHFSVCRMHHPAGQIYVLVQLARHRVVLHEAFTPEGARAFAASLLAGADAAETAMLEASNAQLGEALAKGKRS